MTNRLMGAVSPFAHLLGLSTSAAAEDEDEKARRASAEEDEDEKKDAEADDGDGEEKKESRRAEADDGNEDAEEDEDEKKDAKAKAESDDEDLAEDEDEKKGKGARKAAASARRAERARCRAIFASPHAVGRVALAASLAFDSDMSAKQAITALASAPAVTEGPGDKRGVTPRDRLAERMAASPSPKVGPDGGEGPAPGTPQARAARITQIYSKLTGGK